MKKLFTPLILLFGLFTLNGQPYPFAPQTTSVGIDTSILGLPGGLRAFGTGVSVVDFNDDGFDDIVMATGQDEELLWYSNNGDGTFSLIPNPIPLNTRHHKMVLFGDLDNDGDQDLLVTGWNHHNRLYENEGEMTFTDITLSAGLAPSVEETYGASFGDVNNDGFLDMYVCNREKGSWANYLYINNGDMTFSEEAVERGVSDGTQLSFQSLFFDYDNDGDQDLYVVNDRLARNSLFQNDGNGYFTDVGADSGADVIMDAMNAGCGDYNNDGWMDLYITNTPLGGIGDNRMLRNNGDGTFTEVSNDIGVGLSMFSWAGLWLDFDNDTDIDLFIATLKEFNPNVIYQNSLADFGLELFLNPWPMGIPEGMQESFSAAYFDYNNDGKLDIVIPNADPSPVQVWENISTTDYNWVKFGLEGVHSPRDGVGTRVELTLGGNTFIRYMAMGDHYMSQNHKMLHFGLKDATNIDQVVVKWLSGVTDTYYDLPVNMLHELVEGASFTLPVQVVKSEISCAGANDGSITLSSTEGVGPYTIEWSTGSTSFTLEDLGPGRYSATITDSEGAQGYALIDLVEPARLDLAMTSENADGPTGGTAGVEASGGTPTYSYLWNTEATTAEVTDLLPGFYSVVVTDDRGCSNTGYAAIYDSSDECFIGYVTEVIPSDISAELIWGEVPNAQVVRVLYREEGTTEWSSAISNDGSVILEELTPGTTYEYQTKSLCAGGEKSDWSPIGTFTTLTEGAAPCDAWVITEILVDNNTAVLKGISEPGATAYRVRYRPIGSMTWDRKASPYAFLTLEPILSGTEFELQTSTRCANGWTPWSDNYLFTTEEETVLPDNEDSQPTARNAIGDIDPAEVSIYPNPASDLLVVAAVDGQPQEMVLQDMTGRIVLRQQTTGTQTELDISTLSTGSFVLQVFFADKAPVTQTVIIAR